ncbi:MAG: nucleoside/nucleotide kinase family protein [Hyphomicrobiaceae bacterium]
MFRRLLALPRGRRWVVAIAGPPAAGKSTVAGQLVDRVNMHSPNRAAVLSMDGFHFDDQVLTKRGRLGRKGAPDTFDVGGLFTMLRRLRENVEEEIAIPVFDREIEIARAGAGIIPRTVEIIIVEGNYLLVRQEPWIMLGASFDIGVLIDVEETELRRRLRARWTGVGLDEDHIQVKLEENDMPNGRFVIAQSREADVILCDLPDLSDFSDFSE